jgi:hypothetical protein
VRVSGRAFALLAPEEREARLEEYGAVLAALARDDSPVRRISWIERTLPADADALGSYLLEAKRIDATLEDPPDELVSYLQLIGRAGDVAEEHELLFSLQIDTHRPAARRAITRMGGGDLGALAVLAGETGQLIELLDEAGITVTGAAHQGRPRRRDPRRLRPVGRASTPTPARPWRRRPRDRRAHRDTRRTRRAVGALRAQTARCTARSGPPSGRGSTSAHCSCSHC